MLAVRERGCRNHSRSERVLSHRMDDEARGFGVFWVDFRCGFVFESESVEERKEKVGCMPLDVCLRSCWIEEGAGELVGCSWFAS
jgi:hypothetical protein